MITLTNRQARQFILIKQGLLGDYKYTGAAGALAFIRQAGCIQYDPINTCGRNADLVLQSRVKKYEQSILDKLLYQDRLLVDYPDKQLAIFPVEDWPYFERYRKASRRQAEKHPQMDALIKQVYAYIKENGVVCSSDLHLKELLQLEGDFHWQSAIHWSGGSNLSRSVLEQMYTTGDLIIHHKKDTRKYYDLADRYIPQAILQAKEPIPDEYEHKKWRVLRRIKSIGLLWNRPSDVWLNIWGLKAPERNAIFEQLLHEGSIIEVEVEGIKEHFYCDKNDLIWIEYVLENHEDKKRCEFIAPLDNLLWDRRLIKSVFEFEYTWEIYTPADKRSYGYYVLPILWGDNFIGRIEAAADKKTKTLAVKNIWYEKNVKQTKKLQKAIDQCIKRFAKFNNCQQYSWQSKG